MEVAAYLRGARASTRKVQLLRQMLVGLPVREAEAQLLFAKGKAPRLLRGVLRSAVANAKHNFELDDHSLVVADVVVSEGTRLKRYRPVSRGTAHPYQRRTSHITVIVRDTRAQATGQAGRKKKADIETLSARELARHTAPQQHVEEKQPAGEAEAVDAKTRVDKELEAYQKMKIQQRGGDRKKTYRRKSI